MDAASAHIGGLPITFGFPGMQVKPFVPSRNTTIFPCESVSTMRADFAISGGPADMARSILACTDSVSSAEDEANKAPRRQTKSFMFLPPLAVETKLLLMIRRSRCRRDTRGLTSRHVLVEWNVEE